MHPLKVRFAPDSSLEGDGFELSVPVAREPVYIAEGELRGDRRGSQKILRVPMVRIHLPPAGSPVRTSLPRCWQFLIARPSRPGCAACRIGLTAISSASARGPATGEQRRGGGLIIGAPCRQGGGEPHTQRAVQPKDARVGGGNDGDGSDPARRNHSCEESQGRSPSPGSNRETLGRVMAT